MKTEKLFELLILLDGVKIRRWETVMKLVEFIANGDVDVKEKKWDDEWKNRNEQYYPLDLAKRETWSAFDNTCIDLNFDRIENDFVCKVKIYDGNSFGGERTKLRFTAKLLLPTKFIHCIEHHINWKFESFLQESYENHLESQRKLWINELKSQILGSVN